MVEVVKRFVLFLSVFGLVFSLAGCGDSGGSGGNTENERLSGGWIVSFSAGALPNAVSAEAYIELLNFIVTDGKGDIASSSFYNINIKSSHYNVNKDGSFSVTLVSNDGTTIITGTLESDTSGIITGPVAGSITKVTDMAACSNISTAWTLWLAETLGPASVAAEQMAYDYAFHFLVDETGKVTDASSAIPVTKGQLICQETDPVIGFFETGETGAYSAFRIVGTYGTPPLFGDYDNDSANPWPVGQFELVTGL